MKTIKKNTATTDIFPFQDGVPDDGEHNFTIATIAMLSSFFGQPIITVG